MQQHTNRLAKEKSPYLQQHAHNPVDWYPWGEEAFRAAVRRDVPIFLSIGYSTCHWCHVMERESFEDTEVAELMNQAFVCIKVDREERPDIDTVYMTVAQLMTGAGGWPLTIIMTPDKKPFFAGTYIPRQSRFGRIGMLELLPRIRSMWRTRRAAILDSATRTIDVLDHETSRRPGTRSPDRSCIRWARDRLRDRFDDAHGGFGDAPKFPAPHNLLFLLRYWMRSGDEESLRMAEKTLQAMRLGGIYDHIGFGFHRYSTDRRWFVPHFEKMLYDQALLAMAYTEAFQATGNPFYERTARETLGYVLRDMTDPAGGFYSARDAESEQMEGTFYLWTTREIRDLLPQQDADWTIRTFQMSEEGNFREEASGRATGCSVPHLEALAAADSPDGKRWEAIRQKLFAAREKREHPLRDDKILTDWNGLMIAAMAKAGQVFGDARYDGAARGAAAFVLDRMRTREGELVHRYRLGEAALPAHIDDYAFMVWGLLALYETTFEVGYLSTAMELQEAQARLFWDDAGGGFFFTSAEGAGLPVRPKEAYDGAVPSGNSVSMHNLLRLARMTGNPAWEQRANRLVEAFGESIERQPSAHSFLLSAPGYATAPSSEVVIVGSAESADTKAMLDALRSVYIPDTVVLVRPAGEPEPSIAAVAPFTRTFTPLGDTATAYVCRNNGCEPPTNDPREMVEMLRKPL